MQYTSLFLDLDNTLLDFDKAEESAITRVLKKHGLPCNTETVKKYSEINLSYWKRFERGEIKREDIFENRFADLLSFLGRNGNIAEIAKDYFACLSEGYFTVDGAEDILEYLKKSGYKLYITTNGISLTQLKRIRNSGVEKYTDGIFVSENTGHQKPEKEYFEYVMDRIPENGKSRILIIGDSQSSDILGGIRFGIDTCWFNPKGETAKYESRYEISHLLQLKRIL